MRKLILAVGKAAHRVISTGELILPLSSCSTWESGLCLDNIAELILTVEAQGESDLRAQLWDSRLHHSSAVKWPGLRRCPLVPYPSLPEAVWKADPGVMRAGELTDPARH